MAAVFKSSQTLNALAASIDALPSDLIARLATGFHKFNDRVTNAALDFLRENDINVDGDLAKSIAGEVIETTNTLISENFSTSLYGEYRHEGTRPHWPPPAPIADWVKKKLGITEAKELRSVTFLVQRKIAAVGTEGAPFLFEAFDLLEGQSVGEEIPQLAVDAVAQSIIDNVPGASSSVL